LREQRFSQNDAPWIFRALAGAERYGLRGLAGEIVVIRDLLLVRRESSQVIGVLAIESGLLAYERHRRRNSAFRWAIRQLQQMALRGELEDTAGLTPFGEHDGVIFVDSSSRIQYTSGIATSLYRRLGYLDSLIEHKVSVLEPADAALVDEAMRSGRCLERETDRRGLTWIQKAIPIRSTSDRGWPGLWQRLTRASGGESRVVGVLVTIHDATEARRTEQELRVKATMIQEIHHRVKNNLQVIASLLRMQARRVGKAEGKLILEESINRILSVAVVHEFLSQNETRSINIRDVAQRIVSQTAQSIMDPSKRINLKVTGPSVYLPAQQATICALAINELVQNALEHAFEHKHEGRISVSLGDDGESISISVRDDGEGLPEGFDLMRDGSLGLRIVQALVQDDLRGTFELRGNEGVEAIAVFPKSTLGGGENWSEKG
jgi:two-component sensor histidine kinase